MSLAVKQREEYKQRIASSGVQFSEAIQIYSAKRGKKDDRLLSLAQCPNLPNLGGCTGKDITNEFIELIQEDKYWQKSMKKAGLIE